MMMDKYPGRNIFVSVSRDSGKMQIVLRGKKSDDGQTCFSFQKTAAKCDFGDQTQDLVYYIFILNMSNKQLQETFCTEPNEDPAEAFQYAIAFEGLRRQKPLDSRAHP